MFAKTKIEQRPKLASISSSSFISAAKVTIHFHKVKREPFSFFPPTFIRGDIQLKLQFLKINEKEDFPRTRLQFWTPWTFPRVVPRVHKVRIKNFIFLQLFSSLCNLKLGTHPTQQLQFAWLLKKRWWKMLLKMSNSKKPSRFNQRNVEDIMEFLPKMVNLIYSTECRLKSIQ